LTYYINKYIKVYYKIPKALEVYILVVYMYIIKILILRQSYRLEISTLKDVKT